MSSTFGIGKSTRCEPARPRSWAASAKQLRVNGLSPMAVATKQTRGARPVTPASSIAYSVSGPSSHRMRVLGTIPPEVARIVGASAVMIET